MEANLRKVARKFRGISLDKLTAEVDRIANLLEQNQTGELVVGHNLHRVPINNVVCPALDAKYVNNYTNQSGRGNYRWVVYNDKLRLAKHKPNRSDYLLVA